MKVADLRVGGRDDVLVTIGLGSCVAILLYDATTQIGGMAHILLPSPALTRRGDNVAKVPQTAVPKLIEEMHARGAAPQCITARLAGGASMFAMLSPPGTIQMGERNLVASRQVLHAHAIPVVAEAVGGDFGRTVRFRLADGRAEIFSVAHGTSTF